MISQQGLVDPDAVEPNQSALDLLRSLHKPIRDFNESVERAKADRTFGRMEMQAFRDIGMNEKDATVWDYISGDDDVVVVERATDSNGVVTDSLIHANVVDTAILKDPPAARKRKIDDIDLQNKDPRRRVPCSLPKGCVWLRKYKEVTEIGTALPGYQNNRRGRHAQKYWKLPLETNEPLQWWPTTAVLGHCRMEREDGLAGGNSTESNTRINRYREDTRSQGLSMCYDRNRRDFKLLIDKYHKDMEETNDTCYCSLCRIERQ